jgi:hypothetical protein
MVRKEESSDGAFNASRGDTTLSQKVLNVARALNARIWSMRENHQASAYVAAREAASWVLCFNNTNVLSLLIFLVLPFAVRSKYCPDTDVSKCDMVLMFLNPFFRVGIFGAIDLNWSQLISGTYGANESDCLHQLLTIGSGCSTSQYPFYTFSTAYPMQNCIVHAVRLVQRSIFFAQHCGRSTVALKISVPKGSARLIRAL